MTDRQMLEEVEIFLEREEIASALAPTLQRRLRGMLAKVQEHLRLEEQRPERPWTGVWSRD